MKRVRLFLLPFSLLYWLVVAVRNWFFDIGVLKTTKTGTPVVSVGNLSVGGVGKTPIVELLVETLSPRLQVSVVSRGYGRKSSGLVVVSDGKGRLAPVEMSGDEPGQLAGKYSQVIFIADEDRVRGSQKAIELGAEVVLLDDGFQHRYLYRDLNIVVMTAGEVLQGDWLLPAGNRREPMSSLRRSDVIVVSRCPNLQDFHSAKSKLDAYHKPVVGMQTKLKSIRAAVSDRRMDLKDLAGKKIVAFSGIGNPGSFDHVLNQAEMKIVQHFEFSDHHWYSQDDIAAITRGRVQWNADALVTTEKDAARLRGQFGGFLGSENVLVAEICQEIISGKELLDDIIKRTLV
jgi:tetraacyldisaccharide 4'-kinase